MSRSSAPARSIVRGEYRCPYQEKGYWMRQGFYTRDAIRNRHDWVKRNEMSPCISNSIYGAKRSVSQWPRNAKSSQLHIRLGNRCRRTFRPLRPGNRPREQDGVKPDTTRSFMPVTSFGKTAVKPEKEHHTYEAVEQARRTSIAGTAARAT